jgi:E3 ubiquitin-protein ligase HUWE1
MFYPDYALFVPMVDGVTFQPNPLSFVNENHIDWFKFIGRIIGKAVVDGQLLDCHFTRY